MDLAARSPVTKTCPQNPLFLGGGINNLRRLFLPLSTRSELNHSRFLHRSASQVVLDYLTRPIHCSEEPTCSGLTQSLPNSHSRIRYIRIAAGSGATLQFVPGAKGM
jgi:hypothetical protein